MDEYPRAALFHILFVEQNESLGEFKLEKNNNNKDTIRNHQKS